MLNSNFVPDQIPRLEIILWNCVRMNNKSIKLRTSTQFRIVKGNPIVELIAQFRTSLALLNYDMRMNPVRV